MSSPSRFLNFPLYVSKTMGRAFRGGEVEGRDVEKIKPLEGTFKNGRDQQGPRWEGGRSGDTCRPHTVQT